MAILSKEQSANAAEQTDKDYWHKLGHTEQAKVFLKL